ncbi:MAG TPA: amidase [Streptosporangiaceae bacterium]|nr:amidase [Streptosporangiaceae bacterium]
MDDLHYLSATDALAKFASKELSPVELVEAVIRRAETVEPVINAFAQTFFGEALAAARKAEARYCGRGDPPRPLEGLPVAVKEEAQIAGHRRTLGSVPLRHAVAARTEPFAQRIIDAGAIVHARTTTPEFCAAPVTWSKLWGTSRNPWNRKFSPGGSSGGSAAALAAGSAMLATGSDIGGSIRIPASFCGVAGFKPPYGRVPALPPFSLDHYSHIGPLARTVADCALLENVIAGPHPSDIATIRPKLEIPARLDGIGGLRIAVSADLGCYRVDAEVAAGTMAAAGRLRAAGAKVEEVSLPWSLRAIDRAARVHFAQVFGPWVKPVYAEHGSELTKYASGLARDADRVTKDDYVAGLSLEAEIYAPLGELLEEYDALICPTFAVPALGAKYRPGKPIEIDGQSLERWVDVMMTLPFNIASRCPVLNVPAGLSSSGVPIGLSVVGRTYDDVTVFRVAAAHAERLEWTWPRVA